ncbi:MAG: hypothetical protein R2844_03430 [Caldilineales bacterium]
MQRKHMLYLLPVLILLVALPITVAAQETSTNSGAGDSGGNHAIVVSELKHDLSPALRDITPPAETPSTARVMPLLHRTPAGAPEQAQSASDPVRQTDAGGPGIPAPIQNWEGIDNIDGVYPPDTNGDVGPNHYVQIVNIHFAVYSKTGALLYGPVPNNTLWVGFGGPCETTNDGDPIVLYDEMADRWLLSQFALPNFPNGPFYQCIAVSQTGDPTGAWYRYAYQTSATKLNDYPKFGVWPDGYYMTANLFQAGSLNWAGTGAYVFDRTNMLAGAAATMQFFELPPSDWGGLLPADLDGSTPPPAGEPNYMAEVVDGAWDPGNWPNDEIHFHKFHVDWTTPANSTFNFAPIQIPVAPFSTLCVNPYIDACIPQLGGPGLNALDDRGMYRLAYRNFGDHESLVFNHTINNGTGQAGVRWYELRDPGAATPTLYQEGTYSPADGLYRWMGSIAMDQDGNMALGYSTSSSQMYAAIRYTGRLASDPLGTMPQGEGSIMAGTGAQTGTAHRWGDYSMMGIDPVDGCTFWYTNEYIQTTGPASWQTRVASFKFPECGQPSAPSIELNKTVGTTPGVCAAGDNITVTAGTEVYYCYQVTNTGDVEFNFHDLVDSELGTILDKFPYTLAPGASSPQVLVPATPMASVTNSATWTAYDAIGGFSVGPADYNWQGISGTGTFVPLSDDDMSPAIPLGFTFDYYGTSYSDIYISSNGFLTVLPGQYNGCCSGQPIPTPGDPDGVIAGWWDDLNPNAGGAVYYETMGTAPNRVFIVEFNGVPHFPDGNNVSMEFKLYEGTNVIEVHYQAAPNDGSQHSAGVENQDGTVGVQYYLGFDPLPSNSAVRYTPAESVSASSTDTATVNVLIPNIDVSPLSLESTQPPDTTAQENMSVANTGQGDLMWEITEVEPSVPPAGLPAAPPHQRPVITSSKECGSYMGNYAGPMPDGFMQYCAPAHQQSAPTPDGADAPTDTAYSLDLNNATFFSFTLNNFLAQNVIGPQFGALFAMDFNADATTMYAIDYYTNDFGTLDLNTGAFNVFGSSVPLAGQSWTGLTIDPLTNEAYASSCDITTSAIYSIDLGTGAATLIGTTTDAPCLIDIAIGPSGVMYGNDIVTDSIYTVNRNTGAVSYVGLTGYDANYAQGMDFDNDDGTLYVFLWNWDTFGTIYGTVNLATGAVTPLAYSDYEYEGAVQNTSYCAPLDAPWLSLNPMAGTNAGGTSTNVAATFDSTGLAPGIYTSQLCIRSNDPDNGPGNETSLVIVPVTLNVVETPPFYCNMPNENFDSGVPPAGWTVVNNAAGGASWGDIANCQPSGSGGNWTGGGGNAACMSPGTVGPPHAYNAELRSPMFSLAGQSSASISYLANYQNWAGNDRLNLDISADGGATWTTLLTWNQDYGAFQNLPGVSAWADLTPFVGMNGLMLRWHYFWDDPLAIGWYAQVDNVGIDCTEVPPTAVTLGSVSANPAAPLASLPLATLPAAAAAALGAAFVWRRKRD